MMGTAEVPHVSNKPRSPHLTNLGRFCGAVGLLVLVSTPLTWLLSPEFSALVWGKLIVGAFLVAFYLATNPDFFARLAGSRTTGLAAMSASTVVVTLGVVGAANYFAFKYPKEFDLTREGLYTLTDQTTSLLGRLPSEVRVMAFFASYDPQFPAVEDTLERYKTLAKDGKFTYEIIDPQSRPDLVDKYQITEHGPRIVVTARGQDARAKDPTEQELTNAVIKVAEQTSKKIVFLAGHGEGDITDGEHSEGFKSLADAVSAEGYGVEVVNLQTAGAPLGQADRINTKNAAPAAKLEIPKDASVVIVVGPRRALQAPEVAALEHYVDRGGRLIALVEPNVDTGLEALFKQWKIEVQKDLIVDTNPLNRLLGLGAAAPMIQPTPGEHPIVKDLNTPAVMLTARSVKVAAGGLGGVDAQPLGHTGETAWGETHVGEDGTAAKDDADNPPPLDVAVAATREVSGEDKLSDRGRVVVFGDSDWVNNRYLSMQGNQDFILNAINWSAEQEEKIAIRPKSRASSQLFLSGDDLGKLKFFSMDMLPVALVAMGLGIVLIRRQR